MTSEITALLYYTTLEFTVPLEMKLQMIAASSYKDRSLLRARFSCALGKGLKYAIQYVLNQKGKCLELFSMLPVSLKIRQTKTVLNKCLVSIITKREVHAILMVKFACTG